MYYLLRYIVGERMFYEVVKIITARHCQTVWASSCELFKQWKDDLQSISITNVYGIDKAENFQELVERHF